VVIDIRKNSKTFGKFVGNILSEANRLTLYVPPGFAHGFCVLSETAEFHYKVSDFYSPEHDRGILWSDPEVGIDWPKKNFTLSEKDMKHPLLKNTKDLF
jgi:dTDP-4-dehydrorhamnose 3,5-epimerase